MAETTINSNSGLQNRLCRCAAARVDFRLIHGQIAVKWCRAFNVERIVIIDDVVASDKFMTMVYATAAPGGVETMACTEASVPEIWERDGHFGRSTLLLFKDIAACARVIKSGVGLRDVQIGGVPMMPGRVMINRQVFLNGEEICLIKELQCLGVDVSVQVVPEDKRCSADEIFSIYEAGRLCGVERLNQPRGVERLNPPRS